MNFNFGEHYYTNESTIIDFLFTIVGFGIPLLLFYLKNRSDSKKGKQDKVTKSKEKLKYFGLLLNSVESNVMKQRNCIAEYIIKQRKNRVVVWVPLQVPTNDFERINFISNDTFNSFNLIIKDIDWVKSYNVLHSKLDYTAGVYKELYRISESHTNKSYIIQNEIKHLLQRIPNMLNLLASYLKRELDEKAKENKIYIFFNLYMLNYMQLIEEGADFERFDNEFLEPMMSGILEEFKDEQILDEILLISKTTRIKINDLKISNLNIMYEYVKIGQSLKGSLKKIKEIEEIIEKNDC